MTLDTILDKIGTFTGAPVTPPPGKKSVTFTVVPSKPSDLADPTNTCRVDVEAETGTGWRLVKRGTVSTGGTGKPAPATTYTFDALNPPVEVRGVLVNITECPYGLADAAFA